jgi:hypothetical protein
MNKIRKEKDHMERKVSTMDNKKAG